MAGIFFYRERRKVGEGEKKPRYTLVAVTDLDLTFYPKHMRKKELEQIAEAVGAELVLLTHGEKEKEEEWKLRTKGESHGLWRERDGRRLHVKSKLMGKASSAGRLWRA